MSTVPFRTVVSPCALDAATSVEHNTSASSVTPVRTPLVIQREHLDPVVLLVGDVEGAVRDLHVGRVLKLPWAVPVPRPCTKRLHQGATGRELDQTVQAVSATQILPSPVTAMPSGRCSQPNRLMTCRWRRRAPRPGSGCVRHVDHPVADGDVTGGAERRGPLDRQPGAAMRRRGR